MGSMTQKVFFGFDVGTSSTKAVLIDTNGQLLNTATTEHTVTRGEHGLVEMPMFVWWQEFKDLYRALIGGQDFEVIGIGLSGMGPCVGMTSLEGIPIAPSALYGVDWRATDEIQKLTTRYGEDYLLHTYDSALTSQAGGPKIAWFQQRYTADFERGVRFFMPHSWVIWHLTGEYTLDRHSASQMTPLYRPETGEWDDSMVSEIGGKNLEMPCLGWSNEIAGETRPNPEIPELKGGIPVIFGTIDAWAEQESVGATENHHLFLMYGTTLFLIANTDRRARHLSMWGTAGTRKGTHHLAGGLATSGALTSWLRDLTEATDFAQLIAEAEGTPAGAHGLLALPYFAGERTPIQDADARGTLIGLTLDHTRGHIYRALLESTAFAVRHNIETMEAAGANIQGITCAGGGVKSDFWPQIISDVTGREQVIRKYTIGASLGDAFMVAQTLGVASDINEWNPINHMIHPREVPIYNQLYPDYRQLYVSTKDIQHRLSRLQG
ncbi:sugar kinase [Rothia nasimurium]|uniref:Sugar kinase n=2 Tax=Rothia nasimurium TaxID=85336 RepID=A0A4Y9F2W5_9MICC|nr:sugar kinase [Rothia nasimurium]